MPNKFGGICYKCGHYCPPGAGVFEKVSHMSRKKWPAMPRSLKWQVQHHECVRDYSQTAHYEYNPESALYADAKYQLKQSDPQLGEA